MTGQGLTLNREENVAQAGGRVQWRGRGDTDPGSETTPGEDRDPFIY